MSFALIIINLSILKVLFVNCSDDEYRLLQDLKERYDPIERPVQNHTEAVKVSLHLYLQQIVDVDEKNQVLTVVLWEEFRWFDYKMRWDPREYGGIKKIRFPTGTLWRPDVLLFNSADENFDARFDVNFVVNNDGSILYSPPALIKSSCKIDITWFPFDEQMCLLKVGRKIYCKASYLIPKAAVGGVV
uniref:Neurotransmitter-gated ion-channel ligand-binding domain-containing protein n=1 Tax=Meloidogyne incognita TaxID=6306 RepID=A0A914NQJ5_MELIC